MLVWWYDGRRVCHTKPPLQVPVGKDRHVMVGILTSPFSLKMASSDLITRRGKSGYEDVYRELRTPIRVIFIQSFKKNWNKRLHLHSIHRTLWYPVSADKRLVDVVGRSLSVVCTIARLPCCRSSTYTVKLFQTQRTFYWCSRQFSLWLNDQGRVSLSDTQSQENSVRTQWRSARVPLSQKRSQSLRTSHLQLKTDSKEFQSTIMITMQNW